MPSLPNSSGSEVPRTGGQPVPPALQQHDDILLDQLFQPSEDSQSRAAANQFIGSDDRARAAATQIMGDAQMTLDRGSVHVMSTGGTANHPLETSKQASNDMAPPTPLSATMPDLNSGSGFGLSQSELGPSQPTLPQPLPPLPGDHIQSMSSDRLTRSVAPGAPLNGSAKEPGQSQSQVNSGNTINHRHADQDGGETPDSRPEAIYNASASKSARSIRPTFDSRRTAPELVQRTDDEDVLEARIERVLESIRRAGFPSLEQFAIAYFTADLDADSPAYTAQSLSRSRHLRELLAALSCNARHWSTREAQGFRDEIVRSAEQEYTQELQLLTEHMRRETTQAPTPSGEASPGKALRLEHLTAHLVLQGGLKHRKKEVQEEVCQSRQDKHVNVSNRARRRLNYGAC